MTKIGKVLEIMTVKDRLESLKQENLVVEWELPYESILTRLSAAIFFLNSRPGSDIKEICSKLPYDKAVSCKPNEDKSLSQLEWRLEFSDSIA